MYVADHGVNALLTYETALTNRDANFRETVNFATGDAKSIVAADLNQDEILDLVVADYEFDRCLRSFGKRRQQLPARLQLRRRGWTVVFDCG